MRRGSFAILFLFVLLFRGPLETRTPDPLIRRVRFLGSPPIAKGGGRARRRAKRMGERHRRPDPQRAGLHIPSARNPVAESTVCGRLGLDLDGSTSSAKHSLEARRLNVLSRRLAPFHVHSQTLRRAFSPVNRKRRSTNRRSRTQFATADQYRRIPMTPTNL
jgi:hypothetical protein